MRMRKQTRMRPTPNEGARGPRRTMQQTKQPKQAQQKQQGGHRTLQKQLQTPQKPPALPPLRH
jgi:hypothetical protein